MKRHFADDEDDPVAELVLPADDANGRQLHLAPHSGRESCTLGLELLLNNIFLLLHQLPKFRVEICKI